MDLLAQLFKPLTYARNLTLQTVGNERVKTMLSNSEEPYDAIIEYWWESAGEFYDHLDSPEVIALLEQIAKEDTPYIDRQGSNGFFTEGNLS